MEVQVQLARRNVLLSAAIALVVLISAFLALAPKASAVKSDCPANTLCLWSGPTFGGDKSFWPASAVGKHNLENIDPKSAWNRTNRNVSFTGGTFTSVLFPGNEFSNLDYGYNGHIYIN